MICFSPSQVGQEDEWLKVLKSVANELNSCLLINKSKLFPAGQYCANTIVIDAVVSHFDVAVLQVLRI